MKAFKDELIWFLHSRKKKKVDVETENIKCSETKKTGHRGPQLRVEGGENEKVMLTNWIVAALKNTLAHSSAVEKVFLHLLWKACNQEG